MPYRIFLVSVLFLALLGRASATPTMVGTVDFSPDILIGSSAPIDVELARFMGPPSNTNGGPEVRFMGPPVQNPGSGAVDVDLTRFVGPPASGWDHRLDSFIGSGGWMALPPYLFADSGSLLSQPSGSTGFTAIDGVFGSGSSANPEPNTAFLLGAGFVLALAGKRLLLKR